MREKFQLALRSTNFYFAALMLIGTGWGLAADVGLEIITAGNALIAAAGLALQYFKNNEFIGWRELVKKDANTWNYLVTLLGFFVTGADQIIPALAEVVDALVTKQWSVLITKVVTLFTVVYFIFFRGQTAKEQLNA